VSYRWRWKPCDTAGFVLTLVMLWPPARAFNGEWSPMRFRQLIISQSPSRGVPGSISIAGGVAISATKGPSEDRLFYRRQR
jgi:hypothetical protein